MYRDSFLPLCPVVNIGRWSLLQILWAIGILRMERVLCAVVGISWFLSYSLQAFVLALQTWQQNDYASQMVRVLLTHKYFLR